MDRQPKGVHDSTEVKEAESMTREEITVHNGSAHSNIQYIFFIGLKNLNYLLRNILCDSFHIQRMEHNFSAFVTRCNPTTFPRLPSTFSSIIWVKFSVSHSKFLYTRYYINSDFQFYVINIFIYTEHLPHLCVLCQALGTPDE